MISSVRLVYLALFLWGSFTLSGFAQEEQSPLQGKTICPDQGHGGAAETDQYRAGIIEAPGEFNKQRETETRMSDYYIPLQRNDFFRQTRGGLI